MADREIEIQVQIEHGAPLWDFLEAHATFQREERQRDEYFSPPHRDFLGEHPAREWLRLREAEGHAHLTYKHYHYDAEGRSLGCDEVEVPIEHPETLRKIFAALNFRPLVVVEKTRRTWTYEDYEIALDTVAGLGDFVEIEYRGDFERADPREITDGMVRFLKDLGCGRIERNNVGYPYLLLFGAPAAATVE